MHLSNYSISVPTEKNGLSFIETSALDSTNVEAAFQTILTGESSCALCFKGKGRRLLSYDASRHFYAFKVFIKFCYLIILLNHKIWSSVSRCHRGKTSLELRDETLFTLICPRFLIGLVLCFSFPFVYGIGSALGELPHAGIKLKQPLFTR